MVRSLWIGAVVVGLAWTGLAKAQTGAAPLRERYITVREDGRTPQRCKLLKTWRENNGAKAYQVQAVDTGELLTIVESGSASAQGTKALATRIFRWSRDNKPPTYSPTPPLDATVLGTPIGQTGTHPATPQRSASAQPATIPTPILPQPMPATSSTQPAKPKAVVASWTNKDVKTPSVNSTPATLPNVVQKSASPAAAATTAPRLMPSANGTTVSQTPCDACGQPSCVCCTPCESRPGIIRRIFKPSSTPTVIATKPATSAPPTVSPSVLKVATAPAQPSDWRESWGKVQPWTPTKEASTDKTATTPTQHVTRQPVRIDPPRRADPLKDPDWYHSAALKEKPANSKVPDSIVLPVPPRRKETVVVKNVTSPMTPPVAPSTDLSGSVPSPTQPRRGAVELPANESNAFWVPPPVKTEAPKYNAFGSRDGAQQPPTMGGPPGMTGASRPPMGPMAGMPMGGMPMPLPTPRPPMMPPSVVNSGVPSGMGNAFTLAGSRRPIPADFGPTPQEPNGFGDAVPNMVQGPAVPPRPNVPPQGMAGYPQMPMQHMAAMTPAASVPAGVPQMLTALKDSLFPSQRESAAEQLSEQNWHAQPHIVQSLTKAAKEDPAATVRAACVRSLAHMKVNTVEVVAVVRDLKNDRDPRVREEVDEALIAFGVAGTPRQDSAVQPASHR